MKQKIKAVFFDFDWTLFDHKTHTFVPSAIDAINQIQKNGVKIFINSARSYYSLAGLNTFENLHFDGFVVSNGASTFLKDKILYAHFLCKEKVEEIRNVLEKENVSYMISTINDAYIKNVDNDSNVKRFYEVFYEPYKFLPLSLSYGIYRRLRRYTAQAYDYRRQLCRKKGIHDIFELFVFIRVKFTQ